MTLLVPASAVSYINADLGPSQNYPWINVTWSLGAAILVSVAGRLSDIFGRRYFMLCGASISFIGTIVGATGQNIPQMILSGILFGIGSGFQELGFACIMEFIPNRYRLTALGKCPTPPSTFLANNIIRTLRHFRTALHLHSTYHLCFHRTHFDRMARCLLADVWLACFRNPVPILLLLPTHIHDKT